MKVIVLNRHQESAYWMSWATCWGQTVCVPTSSSSMLTKRRTKQCVPTGSRCHESITWVFHHGQSWMRDTRFTLPGNMLNNFLSPWNQFWVITHADWNPRFFKIYTQHIKFTFPERQRRLSFHAPWPSLSISLWYTQAAWYAQMYVSLWRESFLLCQLCFIKALFSLLPLSITSVKFI